MKEVCFQPLCTKKGTTERHKRSQATGHELEAGDSVCKASYGQGVIWSCLGWDFAGLCLTFLFFDWWETTGASLWGRMCYLARAVCVYVCRYRHTPFVLALFDKMSIWGVL